MTATIARRIAVLLFSFEELLELLIPEQNCMYVNMCEYVRSLCGGIKVCKTLKAKAQIFACIVEIGCRAQSNS
jgi:hypothetical protein